MAETFRSHITFGLKQILLAVAKFCLRHSIRVQDLWELLKEAFIEVSIDEMARRGEKATISRLSVMTGLHRREVMKQSGRKKLFDINHSTDLISKIIGQWNNDPQFCNRNKAPLVLSYSGMDSEFNRLVSKVSNDLNPATILYELERVKAVDRTTKGLKLLSASYSPKTDPEKSFTILRADLDDIISAVEANIFSDQITPNLHARTVYDNISHKDAEKLKKWIFAQGHEFHSRLRSELAKYDRDYHEDGRASKSAKRADVSRAKIVVTAYARVETSYQEKK